MSSRERLARGKINNERQEDKRDGRASSSDSSRYIHSNRASNFSVAELNICLYILRDFFFRLRGERDSHRGMSRSHHANNDEGSAKIMSSSVPLSALLIPSLKEVN